MSSVSFLKKSAEILDRGVLVGACVSVRVPTCVWVKLSELTFTKVIHLLPVCHQVVSFGDTIFFEDLNNSHMHYT